MISSNTGPSGCGPSTCSLNTIRHQSRHGPSCPRTRCSARCPRVGAQQPVPLAFTCSTHPVQRIGDRDRLDDDQLADLLPGLAGEVYGRCLQARVVAGGVVDPQEPAWLSVDPAAVLERRREPDDRTKAVAESSLERLFRRMMSAFGRSASGGCSTRRRHGPMRPCPPTSMISTWRTNGSGCGEKGATPTGCTSNPGRHGLCPG